ncbi:hypothetical protein SAE02_52810 [Skermanella aerolata]|uniref:Uncharacterized protein n=1 Tax=Skermanella aerolata TaxID=393310 RepID=A0A512DXD2_9PROT|nr:hypothetical protein SAE02_52810 [Skermanella aerolata]
MQARARIAQQAAGTDKQRATNPGGKNEPAADRGLPPAQAAGCRYSKQAIER